LIILDSPKDHAEPSTDPSPVVESAMENSDETDHTVDSDDHGITTDDQEPSTSSEAAAFQDGISSDSSMQDPLTAMLNRLAQRANIAIGSLSGFMPVRSNPLGK
jgi:hypothetical protein